MTVVDRRRYLRGVLVVAGLACLALYPLMLVWPSGWTWHIGPSDYPMMIVGIYDTLGVFVILAALAAAPAFGQGESRFHLKPGASGKLCLGCHTDFEELVKQASVHTPVKGGQCVSCHSPHAVAGRTGTWQRTTGTYIGF